MTTSCGFADSSISHEQKVDIDDIQWNDKQHTIIIGDITVALTPTEYSLLYPLRKGMPIAYADLAMMAYHYTADEKVRTMMDKHIDRIRSKLRNTGIYVYCVIHYGYLLLPELPNGAGTASLQRSAKARAK